MSHPQYKTKWIQDDEKKREAIALLKAERLVIESSEFGEQDQSQLPVENAKKPEFTMEFEDADNDEDSQMDEIDRWVKYTKKTDFAEFPFMKKVFLKYNTTLGSQASVERAFSFAKLILGLRRGKLSDENFEKQLLLKANKKVNPKLFKKRD